MKVALPTRQQLWLLYHHSEEGRVKANMAAQKILYKQQRPHLEERLRDVSAFLRTLIHNAMKELEPWE